MGLPSDVLCGDHHLHQCLPVPPASVKQGSHHRGRTLGYVCRLAHQRARSVEQTGAVSTARASGAGRALRYAGAPRPPAAHPGRRFQ